MFTALLLSLLLATSSLVSCRSTNIAAAPTDTNDNSHPLKSGCTGPLAFVTAFNHPHVILVNQPIRSKHYKKLCKLNGYRPLRVRDERELKRVVKELRSLSCHKGAVWVGGLWAAARGKRGVAVSTGHGGSVQLYGRQSRATFPALCRNKKIKKSKKGTERGSRKSKK
jgi:hypothetical protein